MAELAPLTVANGNHHASRVKRNTASTGFYLIDLIRKLVGTLDLNELVTLKTAVRLVRFVKKSTQDLLEHFLLHLTRLVLRPGEGTG